MQDGLVCMFAQRGQVLLTDDDRCMLVLDNHKWAVLTWQLIELESRSKRFQLSQNGCAWEFLYCQSSWRALPTLTTWSEEGICVQASGEPESLPKNTLRFSNQLTFVELVKMAECAGLVNPKPKSLSRPQLLRRLADDFGGNDQDFSDMIVNADEKCSKKNWMPRHLSASCLRTWILKRKRNSGICKKQQLVKKRQRPKPAGGNF